jgi:hypothetical protein
VSKYEHQLRPKKITTRKKGTVVWPAMFFEPPEKITAQKKETVKNQVEFMVQQE